MDEVKVGEKLHCTIEARYNNSAVVAPADAFVLSDADAGGRFGALSAAAAVSFNFTYTAGSKVGDYFISDGVSADPHPLRVIEAMPTVPPTPSDPPTPANPSAPTSSPADVPTPAAAKAGGLSPGAFILIVLVVIVSAVIAFLAWRRTQRRSWAMEDYITHLQSDEPGNTT
jgi:hypothetical protein